MAKKSTFNLNTGISNKEQGMQLAASNKKQNLAAARLVARKLALLSPSRTCDADQVQEELLPLGIDLGAAAGSIFKTNDWVFTGEFRKSRRVSNHARLIMIWRLK